MSDALPQFQHVWQELRLGRHIGPHDLGLFSTLIDNEKELQTLLGKIGYTLVKHPRGFYFLEGDTSEFLNAKRLTRIVVFGLVLVDALSLQHGSIDEWLFPAESRARPAAAIPIFNTDRHRSLLEQAQIRNPDELAGLLREMARLGFTEENEYREFTFHAPFYRIIEACLRAQELGPAGIAQLSTDGAEPAEESADEGISG